MPHSSVGVINYKASDTDLDKIIVETLENSTLISRWGLGSDHRDGHDEGGQARLLAYLSLLFFDRLTRRRLLNGQPAALDTLDRDKVIASRLAW